MKNRIFLTAFLLSVLMPSWAQIGGDYNPESPSDPGIPQKRYTLSAQAIPEDGGSFNIRSERMVAGETYSLYAYTSSDFVFKCWMIGDEVLSEDRQLDFVMPSHDVQITGKFEYNPASPASPNQNFWSKETGDVIVDTFDPDNLSDAIYTTISGSDREEVQTIIVAGKLSIYDFSVANNFPNCMLLDLSRVTGVTEVPSYAFDYSNLESIYLPASIEKIGYYAFGECSKLASITLYAMTPPTLEDDVFYNVPEGLVVYVPAGAIGQYQDSEAWSKFTILPIQEDIRSISVSLPNGTKASDYAKMWLELTNTKSGQRMHYIMTERDVYTFANIIKNTSWNVVLRNERGDVFGKIDNVEVKDEDVSVSFASLTKPQNVSLSVKTPDGKNVTEQTQIIWTDGSGNYIAQGTSLSALPVGYQLNYSVALSQELAMLYGIPKVTAYTLKDGSNSLTCKLKAIKQVQITGKVKDVSTGMALSGAIISASQTFGGKYNKTINTKTEANGTFTLSVSNVPTTMAFAATDYISQSIVCDDLIAGKSSVTMADVSLKPISGATINVGFNYSTVDGETQNWYSDYQNVGYTLYNKTRKQTISQFNVQYPQIVLLEEVSEGDVVELTAESRTQSFMPVKATATITANQTAEAQFSIVELGQLKAEYSQSGNVNVVASLYDSNGKLLKTYDYQDMSLTVSNLADGNYTLVSMSSSQFFNSIYDLAQLPQTGLKAGTDYVQNAISVKSGAVTTVNIDLVPKLDESKLYYTGDNTSFTVNKPSIVAGNYLTLTGHISFKPTYEAGVSNVQMIVDLPEACEFVENSVMVGNSTGSYTLNGHQLTIPMARYSDRVRFCIIPTAGGDYAPSAFAQFKLNGKTIKQPIGSANYTAKDLSISVPSTIAKTSIPVSGTAIGQSNVNIYDNGVLIGQTTSHANGSWAVTCELNDPYNLSTHNIYAKVTGKNGVELQSESKEIIYDMNAIQVSKVTMYHWNPEVNGWKGKNYEIIFDFQNPQNVAQKYIYYIYNKKFTFTIDFTNNDPSLVSDVKLRVKLGNGEWVVLPASFDNNKRCWVVDSEFGNMYDGNIPKNVGVSFTSHTQQKPNANFVNENINSVSSIQKDLEVAINKGSDVLETLLDLYTSDNYDDELAARLEREVYNIYGIEDVSPDEINSEEEGSKYVKELNESLSDPIFKTAENILNGNLFDLSGLAEYGNGVEFTNCDGYDEATIEEKGFMKIVLDDDSSIYYLQENGQFIVVSFVNNFVATINADFINKAKTRASADDVIANAKAFIADAQEKCGKINDGLNKAKDFIDTYQNILGTAYKYSKEKFSKALATLKELARNKRAGNAFPGQSIVAGSLKESAKNSGIIMRGTQEAGKTISQAKNSPLGLAAQKVLAAFDIVNQILTGIRDVETAIALYQASPKECPANQQEADAIRIRAAVLCGEATAFYGLNIAADVVAINSAVAAAASLAPTAGTSALVLVGDLVLIIVKAYACKKYDAAFKDNVAELRQRLRSLKCKKDDEEDYDIEDEDDWRDSLEPDADPSIDPSGYVYEGVFSNRLQGVTATCYYKETIEDMYGDLHDNIVKWDAEEYAQENPLFTDENGYYRWDVPQGLWQVKFEKEGYETTYSEWLPVPPPQLDINIPMKQNVQPLVKSARAFQDAVEFEFDKYMMPELLTTENITVMVGKKAVTGTIKLLDEEVSREGETETFASKVRFNAAKPFEGTEVTLMVSNRVRSYAGIRMQDDFSQQFTIEEEVRQIDCKEMVKVAYGHNSTVSVAVLPASAAAGKTLRVKSSSAMILSTDTESLVLDKDGKAGIKVHGELPGTAALTYSVDGYDLTTTTTVNVVTIIKGDANGDGEVNAADIVVLQNYLSGQHTTDIDESAADADGDGSITVADVPAIVAIILNKR